jgi:hypothetical protein
MHFAWWNEEQLSQLQKSLILFEISAKDVFVEVEPILKSAFDGHNVCVLAYGQTE